LHFFYISALAEENTFRHFDRLNNLRKNIYATLAFFLSTNLEIQILTSYKNINGDAKIIMLIGSVVGVKTAARINIITIECRQYFRKYFEFNIPKRVKINDSIGISNTNPEAKSIIDKNEKYLFISKLFLIDGEPIELENANMTGIKIKNENITPLKKNIDVQKVIFLIQERSFS
jgi:hypothetical protein